MDDRDRSELVMAPVPAVRKAGVAVLDLRTQGLRTGLKHYASPR